jgi:cob(I)alamin adenosyltransferase
LAALLQYGRAVCRRAEREVVRFQELTQALPPTDLQYLNRLSSALFMLGRQADQASGAEEEFPDYYATD